MFITNNLGIKNFNQPIQNKWRGYQSSPLSFGSNRLERSPKCDEVSFSGQKQEPEVTYKSGWKITFPEPTSLKEVSEFLLNPKIQEKLTCFCEVETKAIGDSKIADIKITELLGHGCNACAFLMEDGRVLKISNCNHFRREHEDFDIPVYEEGILTNEYDYPLYYYIEQYANPEDVSEDEINDVVERIKEKGYMTYDICPWQFGKASDGKVYLLDPECAYKI